MDTVVSLAPRSRDRLLPSLQRFLTRTQLGSPPWTPGSDNHPSVCLSRFVLFRMSSKWDHAVSRVLCLAPFMQHRTFQKQPRCWVCHCFVPFYCSAVLPCENTTVSLSTPVRRTSRLFPLGAIKNQVTVDLHVQGVVWTALLFPLGTHPVGDLLGHVVTCV